MVTHSRYRQPIEALAAIAVIGTRVVVVTVTYPNGRSEKGYNYVVPVIVGTTHVETEIALVGTVVVESAVISRVLSHSLKNGSCMPSLTGKGTTPVILEHVVVNMFFHFTFRYENKNTTTKSKTKPENNNYYIKI